MEQDRKSKPWQPTQQKLESTEEREARLARWINKNCWTRHASRPTTNGSVLFGEWLACGTIGLWTRQRHDLSKQTCWATKKNFWNSIPQLQQSLWGLTHSLHQRKHLTPDPIAEMTLIPGWMCSLTGDQRNIPVHTIMYCIPLVVITRGVGEPTYRFLLLSRPCGASAWEACCLMEGIPVLNIISLEIRVCTVATFLGWVYYLKIRTIGTHRK